MSADLPDDVAALQALVLAQQSQLAERDAEIEYLKRVIAKLKRMQFGRRSEQLDEMIGQLELSLEELEGVRAERRVQAPGATAPAEVSPAQRLQEEQAHLQGIPPPWRGDIAAARPQAATPPVEATGVRPTLAERIALPTPTQHPLTVYAQLLTQRPLAAERTPWTSRTNECSRCATA